MASFTISVLTTTYSIEHTLARENRSNRRIKINDYSLSCVPFSLVCNGNKCSFLWKILWFLRNLGGKGVTTHVGFAILGNRSKTFRKHCLRVYMGWQKRQYVCIIVNAAMLEVYHISSVTSWTYVCSQTVVCGITHQSKTKILTYLWHFVPLWVVIVRLPSTTTHAMHIIAVKGLCSSAYI